MGPSTKHQTRNAPFQEKDKCFVMHRDQLYEAKVVKVEAESDGNKRYLVHYNGWGNRHDEWKAHSELLRITEENKKKQQELRRNAQSPEPSTDRSRKNKSASKDRDTPGSSSRKQNSSGNKSSSIAGDGMDTSDLSSGRPDSPDSVKSEVSCSSGKGSVGEGSRPKATGASKTPLRSSRNIDAGSTSEEKQPRKRQRKEEPHGQGSPEAKKTLVKLETEVGETTSKLDSAKPQQTKLTPDSAKTNKTTPESNAKTGQVSLTVEIPRALKEILVDDYDAVVRQKMLVDINSPKSISVWQVIEDFVHECDNELGHHVAYGVRDLFNVVLGSNLLYKFERPQYDELISQSSKEIEMCKVYGPEHFLRFFLKINEFMQEAKLGKNNLATIVPHMKTMVEFLTSNVGKYFDSKNRYVPSSADYLRKSIADYDQ